MKYAIIPILKEIDDFGQRYDAMSQEETYDEYSEFAFEGCALALKLYYANKPTEVSDE